MCTQQAEWAVSRCGGCRAPGPECAGAAARRTSGSSGKEADGPGLRRERAVLMSVVDGVVGAKSRKRLDHPPAPSGSTAHDQRRADQPDAHHTLSFTTARSADRTADTPRAPPPSLAPPRPPCPSAAAAAPARQADSSTRPATLRCMPQSPTSFALRPPGALLSIAGARAVSLPTAPMTIRPCPAAVPTRASRVGLLIARGQLMS